MSECTSTVEIKGLKFGCQKAPNHISPHQHYVVKTGKAYTSIEWLDLYSGGYNDE